MKRKNEIIPCIGASSILMIFVVLCLTTFAALSFATANADRKISEKNAESVKSYYQACSRIQLKLQKIDSALADAQAKSESGSYFDKIVSELAPDSSLSVSQPGGEMQISFSEHVDAGRKISVIVSVNPSKSTPRYRLTEQRLVETSATSSTDDGDGETLHLWPGNSSK